MNANASKQLNWKTPFVIGIAVTAVIGVSYRIFFPPVNARTTRMARVLKIDPHRQQRSEQLREEAQQTASKKTELSEAQWRELVANFNDPNESLKIQTISTMMFLGKTKRRDTVITMVRPLLEKSPMLQVSSLTLLRRFNDPSWHIEAQKRKDSTDKYLSQMASAMLEQGDIK